MKKLLPLVISSLLLSACINNQNSKNQNSSQNTLGLAANQANQENLTDLDLTATESALATPKPESKPETEPSLKKEKKMESIIVILQTSKGNIKLKLYPDKAPNTVTNFLNKARSNFYNNLIFHRVEDWVIQGGDPDGNGTGGGKMPTELSDAPFTEGSLGVARGGDIKISNESQFFICIKDCSWLTGQYTNFGEVIEGMQTAKDIKVGDNILNLTITNQK